MNLLEKLTEQIVNKEIKSGDTMQDWLATLEDEHLDELERLVELLEEEPEDEDTLVLGQVVMTLYAIEKGLVKEEKDELIIPDIEDEDLFFKLLNSFLFLLPFFYWQQQELIEVTPKLSLVANQENKINIKIVEYGKGEMEHDHEH